MVARSEQALESAVTESTFVRDNPDEFTPGQRVDVLLPQGGVHYTGVIVRYRPSRNLWTVADPDFGMDVTTDYRPSDLRLYAEPVYMGSAECLATCVGSCGVHEFPPNPLADWSDRKPS